MKQIFIILCFFVITGFVSCKKEKNNKPPVANAGADQTIALPANSVTVDGRGSSDPDNNIISYAWSRISGFSQYNITNPNSIQTQVTNLVPGVYQFELKVTDAGGLFSKDTVQVIINVPISADCSNRLTINGQLVPVGTLSQARFGLLAAAAGNKILFAGGFVPGAYSTRVDIYDFLTNTWTVADLSVARQGMTSASVGNKIFFAGGGDNDEGTVFSRVDIYDASLNTWSTAELSEARTELTSATIGNKVFFAGGVNNYSGGKSDRVDIYDNSTNSWSTSSLSQSRSQLSAVTAGNKIYFAGGSNFTAPGHYNVSNLIDIYDVVTNTWSTSNLFEGKMAFASIAVADKIYWAGGINSHSTAGYTESDKVEIRNINTGLSSFACIIPKSQFSAVVKDDNIVFFAGYPGNVNRSFDIYNTTTGIWSEGILNQSVNGAAIISVNNIIYIAGGTVNLWGGYFNQVWKLEF